MKCFTIVDDRAPFMGITVNQGKRTGIAGNFCFVGDGVNLLLPIMSFDIPNKYHRPEENMWAVITDASTTNQGWGYPIFVAPAAAEDGDTILVYWTVNEYEKLGKVAPGRAINGIDVIDETSYATLYRYDILFTIVKNGYFKLKFQNGDLTVNWDGKNLFVTR